MTARLAAAEALVKELRARLDDDPGWQIGREESEAVKLMLIVVC